jgi:hypothetical protein
MTVTPTTKGADDHNKEDPPQGGKYVRRAKARRRDQHLRHVAIQVDNGNAAFLLILKAMVATLTATLSTVTLGALSTLGAGTMMIIPGLSLP